MTRNRFQAASVALLLRQAAPAFHCVHPTVSCHFRSPSPALPSPAPVAGDSYQSVAKAGLSCRAKSASAASRNATSLSLPTGASKSK